MELKVNIRLRAWLAACTGVAVAATVKAATRPEVGSKASQVVMVGC